MKGFRPGREPPELRKRQARQRFGDLTRTQERLVELFAERTLEESRGLIRRWVVGLLVTALTLAIVAGLLALWSTIAALVAAALAAVCTGLWWRLRGQREALVEMAETVAGKR